MPILYFQKLVNVNKREAFESKLAKLVISLDNFESAVKKNKTFLQETQVMKSSANLLKRYDKDNMLPSNLIAAIKNVIDTLYTFVKLLESFSVSEKFDCVYEPFENLQDCDLMTMNLEETIDLKVIKVSLKNKFYSHTLTT